MFVKQNIDLVYEKIAKAALVAGRKPEEISLVAVSKGVSSGKILEAVNSGIRDIGENRVQEFEKKYIEIKEDIDWHMIGSLQTNKVKYIIDKVKLIHSLDRISLAKEVDKRAKNIGKRVQALVQVNMLKETTKSGLYEEDVLPFLANMIDYPNIEIKGLMTIGPFATDSSVIRSYFRRFNKFFEDIKDKGLDHIDLKYLSMGMSNDYHIAIEEGANMVRVGRAIFNSG